MQAGPSATHYSRSCTLQLDWSPVHLFSSTSPRESSNLLVHPVAQHVCVLLHVPNESLDVLLPGNCSGAKASYPMVILTTPIISLYSLPPVIFRTLDATSLTTVLIFQVFTLGMRPRGPSIRAPPDLLSFASE